MKTNRTRSNISLSTHLNEGQLKCRFLSAFTLVELLVVIGIVLILAALAFPIYKKSIVASKAAMCASQLRAIGAAIFQYTADNNQKLPGKLYGLQSELSGGYSLHDYIYSYMECPDAVTCFRRYFMCPANEWAKNMKEPYNKGSYRVNTVDAEGNFLPIFGYATTSDTPMTLPQVEGKLGKFSSTWIMSDVDTWNYGCHPFTPPVHGGARNVLYLDGHINLVKTLSDKQIP